MSDGCIQESFHDRRKLTHSCGQTGSCRNALISEARPPCFMHMTCDTIPRQKKGWGGGEETVEFVREADMDVRVKSQNSVHPCFRVVERILFLLYSTDGKDDLSLQLKLKKSRGTVDKQPPPPICPRSSPAIQWQDIRATPRVEHDETGCQ